MFFKDKDEVLLKKLGAKFQVLESGMASTKGQLEDLGQNISKLQTAIHKHDMAIEDLLEEWEEKRSQEEEAKEQFSAFKRERNAFLELFEAYQEQFWNLKRFAEGKDETWAAQIVLMERNLEHYRQMCGITVIAEYGTRVDYDLHEVIETVETENPVLDKTVADIYSCGYIYKGNVKKKARVAAYLAERRS
ncbi:MAG: nucleotide exchange factor GrpE [Eubacterium sp.]|jgi:molecular chaperone GrpE (heat shock protein)|nr:nucleotide exchange factor GrpE [Eubacterium sp.]NBI87134.1 nucleotide exchange factor GrpE [Lachnospiraceae bacterium]